MTRLIWDPKMSPAALGVSHGVLYPRTSAGETWNGLVSVQDVTVGAEQTTSYFDGKKYVQHRGIEDYTAKIEAITYPDILDEEIYFDFSYRVQVGDLYEIHLVYNAEFAQTESTYDTNDDLGTPSVFSWDISTLPEKIDRYRACAHLIINSNEATPEIIAQIDGLIYGTETTDPRMPHLSELIDIFETGAIFKIIDHGDGTWTAIGPDDWFEMIDSTTFKITTPSASYLTPEMYKIHSW